MVVFTCNICGDSVKKTAVEKHYNTKCRGAPVSVSCMDCQKDFKAETYVEHTSCITEAEKYSGKDYVPKASLNAGLKKQQCWLEVVRSILASTDLEITADVRRTLQRLQTYDNVPRKKDKFINFIKNSLRIDNRQAEPVWQVVEVALEKYKEVRFGPKKLETKDEANKDSNEDDAKQETNGHSEENATEESTSKSEKKKKKQKQSTANEEINQSISLNETAEVTDEAPKKKKKKSKDADSATAEDVVQNGTPAADDNTEGAKKKKKRSKGTENEAPNGVEPECTNENGEKLNGDAPSKKKKKKNSEAMESTNETVETIQAPARGKFDWNHEIYSIVEKNSEIEVEKLKNKVLKKFKKINQMDEIPWKVQKTFNKKLRKSGLLVVNNVVKTRS